MTLTTPKIRRTLAELKFSTAHARDIKNSTICHLLTYERSLSDEQINLSSLYGVCEYLAWLSKHTHEIDDKQILPSERLFLAQAFEFCYALYEKYRSV